MELLLKWKLFEWYTDTEYDLNDFSNWCHLYLYNEDTLQYIDFVNALADFFNNIYISNRNLKTKNIYKEIVISYWLSYLSMNDIKIHEVKTDNKYTKTIGYWTVYSRWYYVGEETYDPTIKINIWDFDLMTEINREQNKLREAFLNNEIEDREYVYISIHIKLL